MATAQITIALTAQEQRSLFRMAESDCRDPGEQLRFLLRQEAQERGLLTDVFGRQKNQAVPGGKPTRNDQISEPQHL